MNFRGAYENVFVFSVLFYFYFYFFYLRVLVVARDECISSFSLWPSHGNGDMEDGKIQ
jgi:hypothetical protein